MPQRNRWKIAFLLLLIILVGVVGVAGYLLFDQSVTLTYLEQGYQDTKDDLDFLMKLFPETSRDYQREDLVFLLRKQNPEAFITDNAQVVGIGFLQFEFDSRGKLKKIIRTSDSSQEQAPAK